jgi:hypothetical protein
MLGRLASLKGSVTPPFSERSRYGAIVTAIGETLEPRSSYHRCSTLRLGWPQWQGAGIESVG